MDKVEIVKAAQVKINETYVTGWGYSEDQAVNELRYAINNFLSENEELDIELSENFYIAELQQINDVTIMKEFLNETNAKAVKSDAIKFYGRGKFTYVEIDGNYDTDSTYIKDRVKWYL